MILTSFFSGAAARESAGMSASSMGDLVVGGERVFLLGPYIVFSSSLSRSRSTLEDPDDEKLLHGVDGTDDSNSVVSFTTMLGSPVAGPHMLRTDE